MSILVYTENWDGKFKKVSFELVSYGSQLAARMNTTAVALSIGKVDDSELKKLGNYGAAKVLTVDAPGLEILETRHMPLSSARLRKK